MNVARTRKPKQAKGERIVQEALPVYETRMRELLTTSRYGEKQKKWQDGYTGIGWRVAVLDHSGVCIEEVKDIQQRERRGAPKLTSKILKAQTARFGDMLKATSKLMGAHGIEEESVDGDFLSASNGNIQKINPLLWNGPTTQIDDYVLLSGFMRRMSIQERLGDFDMKIDPSQELEEGRLQLVCVGTGAPYSDDQVNPWLPFTESVTPLLTVHGLSRGSYGKSHGSSMHSAVDHSIKIASRLAEDPFAVLTIEERFLSAVPRL